MDNSMLKMLGQRVRELRKQRELSQEQLGELAGFHFSYIGGVERGQKNISIINLEKIAIALDVPLLEFFIYGIHITRSIGEKHGLLNELHEKLIGLNINELRKIQRIIDEIVK